MSKVGTLYIVAAPSGAGKTSLVRAIVRQVEGVKISVSHTTRPARPSDVEGRDYHFISEEAFDGKVSDQDFLEYAHVFGYRYGTCKEGVLSKIKQGIDVILEIDWQGARQIRQLFPRSVGIFVFPPSFLALKDRLINRNEDAHDVIQSRLHQAEAEMSHYHEFDYLIINDDFDRAVNELRQVIAARRLRTAYQNEAALFILEQMPKTG